MNDPALVPTYALDLSRRSVELESAINKLDQRISDLESKVRQLETRSGLMSRSWFTRAYTVWFYAIAAQAIVAAVLVLLAIAFGML